VALGKIFWRRTRHPPYFRLSSGCLNVKKKKDVLELTQRQTVERVDGRWARNSGEKVPPSFRTEHCWRNVEIKK